MKYVKMTIRVLFGIILLIEDFRYFKYKVLALGFYV